MQETRDSSRSVTDRASGDHRHSVGAPASTQLAFGFRVPPGPRTESPAGQPPQQLRQPGNQAAALTGCVLAIAAATSGLVVQHGLLLRTRPLPALVLVIVLCGVAAAKHHQRAGCRLFQARALARRWRSSARRTTANASRLSRLRLRRLRTGLYLGVAASAVVLVILTCALRSPRAESDGVHPGAAGQESVL
jgi:hypothetical protein